ncbi:hypothetical protein [Rhizobium sp. NLR8a]|uniref:hypothetical protein n=1 Tax=unclassified Rhizobium TaxID=2613769 RepID=UPI001C82D78B|nr:hypothetical protein [Rhizobium sp. NLR8a]MBX5221848.1 hypothetical protein [Rhizobium sp. NLR8a]
MAADRCCFDWMSALQAVLIALALLFVPASGLQAMQCHDGSVHDPSVQEQFERSPLHSDAHTWRHTGSQAPDHTACCSAPCGFCIAAVLIDRLEAPAAQSSFLPFAWRNQTGSGLASPPTLGPPRFPV